MVQVSVIMGIYNCSKTLQEALDSLYTQTFQDFEIILCDDGSSDETYSIASENASKKQNIVLLRNETNRGLNFTLNRCLKVASGRYIARMDGDDISKPDRFAIEYEFLETHSEYAIVSTSMEYFDADGVFRIGHCSGEPRKEDFVKGTPFCHAPCMVRREAYEIVGGYSESVRLLRVEDYHLWLKMYLKGFKGYRLDNPLYMMRDDRNAVARRKLSNRINEMYVKYLVCKSFNLPFHYYLYCLKPLVVWLLPHSLYILLHKRGTKNKSSLLHV